MDNSEISDKQADEKAKKWPQILATCVATLSAVGLGYGYNWTSMALPNLTDCANNPAKPDGCAFGDEAEITAEQGSWIGSLYIVGVTVSALAAGLSLNKVNRKTSIWAATIPSMGGWLLLSLALPLGLSEPYWFYTGRIILGLGNGASLILGPVYVVEIAEPSIRAALGGSLATMSFAGAVSVSGFGSFLPWQVATAIGMVFPACVFMLMPFMPESPYGLLLRGKEAKASKSLRWLRGSEYDISIDIDRMKHSIQDKIQAGNVNLKQLLTDPVYRSPLLIMAVINAIVPLCGISTVAFYLADIFLKAGLNIDNSLASAAEVTLTQLGSGIIAILLVEKTGRKILMLASSSGMCVFMGLLALFFFFDERVEVTCAHPPDEQSQTATTTALPCEPSSGYSQDFLDKIGWLPITTLIFYKFFFCIGYGVVIFPLNAELFALEARNTSVTIVMAVSNIGNFLVTKLAVNVESAIGTSGLYFIFSGICAVASVFTTIFLPETKGRSPQEMRELFQRRHRRIKTSNSRIDVME